MGNELQQFRENNIPPYGLMLTETILEHKKSRHICPHSKEQGKQGKRQNDSGIWYKLKSKMLLGREFPQYLYAKTKSKKKRV